MATIATRIPRARAWSASSPSWARTISSRVERLTASTTARRRPRGSRRGFPAGRAARYATAPCRVMSRTRAVRRAVQDVRADLVGCRSIARRPNPPGRESRGARRPRFHGRRILVPSGPWSWGHRHGIRMRRWRTSDVEQGVVVAHPSTVRSSRRCRRQGRSCSHGASLGRETADAVHVNLSVCRDATHVGS